MSKPLAPNSPHAALIDEAGPLLGWLIDQLSRLFVPGAAVSLGGLRRAVRHYLVPAEAAMRRALYLIALTLTLPAPRTLAKTTANPRAGGDLSQTSTRPRTPLFRFTETAPAPPAHKIPEDRLPRISIPGITPRPVPPPPKPRNPPDFAAYEARILRRFNALEAAFLDPDRAALRLARRLARQEKPRPGLSLIHIPGTNSKKLAAPIRHLLLRLNEAALTEAVRPLLPDTS
ncbi:hypothetical protein [Hyphomonas sp.]|uniref:hypothetical protein n=1 Tax=Hyphomonas sp. TaxID=87 RepID=UPI00391AA345